MHNLTDTCLLHVYYRSCGPLSLGRQLKSMRRMNRIDLCGAVLQSGKIIRISDNSLQGMNPNNRIVA